MLSSDSVHQTATLLDYLIVGAGPGGLQLGYHMQRQGRNYLILEAGDSPGTFFKKFPRHRTLISINKRITGIDHPDTNLRWDWNSLLTDDHTMLFSEYSNEYFPSADAMVEYLSDFARQFDINVRYNASVVRVSKDETFLVECATGECLRAKRLIFATGRPKAYIPDIDGIEYCESYTDCSIDPDDYLNQRVMVVGKGNSGLETADNLINTTATIHLLSPNPVRLAWKTHYVGDLRAVNNNFLDTYQLKSQNTILDAQIERVEKLDDGRLRVHFEYTHADNHRTDLVVDRVLLCTGFKFDDSVFDPESCQPALALNGKFPALTSQWESTNIPGLYFAGTLMHMRDYRKSFSGFIHGFRYNVRFLHQILEHNYEGAPLACQQYPLDADTVLRIIIDRVNVASAMFQQPTFFADILMIKPAQDIVEFYKDFPIDYLNDREDLNAELRLVITMEYGHLPDDADPFNVFRYPRDGTRSAFIHPVIRFYQGKEYIDEHHIPEDLENQWDNDIYTLPLASFLASVFDRIPSIAPTADPATP